MPVWLYTLIVRFVYGPRTTKVLAQVSVLVRTVKYARGLSWPKSLNTLSKKFTWTRMRARQVWGFWRANLARL